MAFYLERSSTAASLPCPLEFQFDLADALEMPTASTVGNGVVSPSPAAAELVAAMPTVASPAKLSCAVCMEDLRQGKRTPCSHVYHAACLSSWLDRHGSCPLCRSGIGSVASQ